MFASFLIPTGLLIIALIAVEYSYIRKDVDGTVRQRVENVATNLELVMGNASVQNEYLTGMTRTSSTLRKVLFEEGLNYGDAIAVHSIQELLLSMKNSYDYLRSVYVYYDDAPRYITSGYDVPSVTGSETWLAAYHEMDDGQKTYTGARTEAGQYVLTVIHKLSLQRGCVVMDVDLNRFKNVLQSTIDTKNEILALYDTRGNCLVFSGADPASFLFSAEASSAAPEDWFADRQGISHFQTGLFGYEPLYVMKIGEPGVYIVASIPAEMTRGVILARAGIYLLVLLVEIGLLLLFSYRITQDSFAHIENILEMFENAAEGKELTRSLEGKTQDEYTVILDNIVQMFLNTSYLSTRLKEEEYKQENAELLALQLQINPHFLFNTLQTLDLEAQEKDSDGKMHRIIQSVSGILKYALGGPRRPVSLGEEIDCLKQYVLVQQYRFGDMMIVYYDVEEDLLDVPVFRMMLQPVVENSLLHGIRPLGKRGYVNVDIHRENGKVRFEVSDTGVGMSEERRQELLLQIRSEEGREIGLRNLNRRLLLYYGEESGLHIEPGDSCGTVIWFEIPENGRLSD